LQTFPIAELLRAAGSYVDIVPDSIAREREVFLEAVLLDFDLRRHIVHREPDASPWAFVLTASANAEEAESKTYEESTQLSRTGVEHSFARQ
jgi:hypothetical protein